MAFQRMGSGSSGGTLSISDTSTTGLVLSSGTSFSCNVGDYYLITTAGSTNSPISSISGAEVIGGMIYQYGSYFSVSLIKASSTTITVVTTDGRVYCYKKLDTN